MKMSPQHSVPWLRGQAHSMIGWGNYRDLLTFYTTVLVAKGMLMKQGNNCSPRKEERLTVCLLHRLHSFSTSRGLEATASWLQLPSKTADANVAVDGAASQTLEASFPRAARESVCSYID